MNDKYLILALAQECGVSVEETEKVLKSLAANKITALNNHISVTLNGLGTFKKLNTLENCGRQPYYRGDC